MADFLHLVTHCTLHSFYFRHVMADLLHLVTHCTLHIFYFRHVMADLLRLVTAHCHGPFTLPWAIPPIPAHHHCHSVADCWHTVHCTFFILGMSWPICCTLLLHTAMGDSANKTNQWFCWRIFIAMADLLHLVTEHCHDKFQLTKPTSGFAEECLLLVLWSNQWFCWRMFIAGTVVQLCQGETFAEAATRSTTVLLVQYSCLLAMHCHWQLGGCACQNGQNKRQLEEKVQ